MTAKGSSRVGAVVVEIERLPHAEGLALPQYQTPGAAGLDLVAALADAEPLRLEPGAIALVPTGLKIALAHGYEAQVRPRSGLALKHGVTVLNSPGTIDSDYRGEVGVILVNHGREAFVVRRGERIAQLVVAPVVQARLEIAVRLDATERGAGGFGSTGRATTPSRTAKRKDVLSTGGSARAKPRGGSRGKRS